MVPRLLVVFVLPNLHTDRFYIDPEYLQLHGKAFWLNLKGYEECKNSTNKTVYIPKKNVFNELTLRKLMILASKGETLQ